MEGNLIDEYFSFGSRFELPQPWDAVPPDPQAFCGPSDPAAALTALLARYTEESVIATGLAQRNGEGRSEIHPFLSIPHGPIVALRDISPKRYTMAWWQRR
jgi:hypothetical protein